ncbi:hypothetical protein POM88_041240 [Heracleum sosnowskyi]|uniref:Uncharacterized protein n=1 Tax=Heracleum sosnowskyi TaxID=360622 RepID=A0AAD8HEE4_9APIA|nr:hypothetical protein POM88_041240 [Heracleum sosnowskyi]
MQDWGNWLRAPPRRPAGQGKSKWLRDDGDADWEARFGRDNSFPQYAGDNSGVTDEVPTGRRDFRREESYLNNKSNLLITNDGMGSGSGQKLITNVNTGLVEDEQNGLFLEDRKRRRSDEEGNAIKDKDGNVQVINQVNNNVSNMEVSLFEMDCATSPNLLLAKLAQQASQSL